MRECGRIPYSCTAFVSLATILSLDDRTKISFFKKGLHAELKKALSYQITLPTGFEEFVQACIKIDNQIRANREARDAIPHTQGGQFPPTPNTSTSTGTHSGPMDLSGARYRCKWGSGLLKSRLCFLTSKNHKQDYKQRGTTTWG